MKILLINPPVFTRGRQVLDDVQEPYTLLSLTAWLKKNGYRVDIIDYMVKKYDSLEIQRKTKGVDAVGISVSTRTLNTALNLARSIKAEGGPFIIAGGPHATIAPQDLLREKLIDVVVRGEGEKTLLEILRRIEGGAGNFGDIDGLAFLSGGEVRLTKNRDFIKDLDTLPWADRTIVDYNLYKKRFWGLKTFSLMAGRGCPYGCVFCSQVVGRVPRWRSQENVINELACLREEFNIRSFIFMDDTLTMNGQWLGRFLDLLEERRLPIYYKLNSRINNITPLLLKRMRNTGLRSIAFGIESGDESVLKRINKGIRLEEIRKVCQWAEEAELEVFCNFMVGFPFEDRSAIKNTITFAASLPVSFLIQSLVTPFPGTELYELLSQEEKNVYDYEKLDFFFDPFKARSLSDFDGSMIMKNKSLSREEIINYFIIFRLYFFKKRILAEIRETKKRVRRFLKNIFREPFRITLALSFPSLRSFTVAVFLRIFRSRRGLKEDLAFLWKMAGFMINSRPYLEGRKKILYR